MPDFTDPQTSAGATPADWYEIVTNGRMDKMMPPWGGTLSDDERWSVANYVYSLGNPDAQQAGAAVAQANTPVATTAGATRQRPKQQVPEARQPLEQRQPLQAAATEAVATATGTVSGTVTNQTEGASVPADLALNLHVISSDGANAQTLNTTVNADGSYSFADVPIRDRLINIC